jgi:hypothetical protein
MNFNCLKCKNPAIQKIKFKDIYLECIDCKINYTIHNLEKNKYNITYYLYSDYLIFINSDEDFIYINIIYYDPLSISGDIVYHLTEKLDLTKNGLELCSYYYNLTNKVMKNIIFI